MHGARKRGGGRQIGVVVERHVCVLIRGQRGLVHKTGLRLASVQAAFLSLQKNKGPETNENKPKLLERKVAY